MELWQCPQGSKVTLRPSLMAPSQLPQQHGGCAKHLTPEFVTQHLRTALGHGKFHSKSSRGLPPEQPLHLGLPNGPHAEVGVKCSRQLQRGTSCIGDIHALGQGVRLQCHLQG